MCRLLWVCPFFLPWISLELFSTLASGSSVVVNEGSGDCSKCVMNKHTVVKQQAMEKLKPICGQKYRVESKEHSYQIGICTNVGVASMPPNIGVLQKEKTKNQKLSEKFWALGNINQFDIMAGENWMYLEYEGGEQYGRSCGQEHRRSIIMITCSMGDYTGTLRFMEEDANRTEECHYLFQLGHDAACKYNTDSGLSVGTIICIVFLVASVSYLVGGILYKRCVVGESGWRLIPNHQFWIEFGKLQADGCSFVCRSRDGAEEVSNDHQGSDWRTIGRASSGYRDERLLPA